MGKSLSIGLELALLVDDFKWACNSDGLEYDTFNIGVGRSIRLMPTTNR